jgi:hypothetical protein
MDSGDPPAQKSSYFLGSFCPSSVSWNSRLKQIQPTVQRYYWNRINTSHGWPQRNTLRPLSVCAEIIAIYPSAVRCPLPPSRRLSPVVHSDVLFSTICIAILLKTLGMWLSLASVAGTSNGIYTDTSAVHVERAK